MSIILLDIGNVIVDVDFLRFCRTVSRAGQSAQQGMFDRYCVSELKKRFDKGEIAPSGFLETISLDPETRSMPVKDIKAAWQDIFSMKEDVPEALGQLRRNHTVWIMSDTDPLHFTYLLNRFSVLRDVGRYWLSFEHGYLKQEPESFSEVLVASGRCAEEFILIDDREDNCRCAQSFGIRSLLFRNWSGILEMIGTF